MLDKNDLNHPQYPRASTYDPDWIIENQMGPNALWLTESLLNEMHISPDMKILDLGCGRAMSSIFLAKETGARIWAADLWISPSDNLQRITEAGLEDSITPLHTEAHQLPFAKGFFDVIVSFDAYHYFGTADLYLAYIIEFLKPGGRIGTVMPALVEELGDQPPPALAPFWESEFCSWHSPEWWQNHWAKTGLVEVGHASMVEGGWNDWLRFNEATLPFVKGWMVDAAASTQAMLEADQGQNLGFAQVLATKK